MTGVRVERGSDLMTFERILHPVQEIAERVGGMAISSTNGTGRAAPRLRCSVGITRRISRQKNRSSSRSPAIRASNASCCFFQLNRSLGAIALAAVVIVAGKLDEQNPFGFGGNECRIARIGFASQMRCRRSSSSNAHGLCLSNSGTACTLVPSCKEEQRRRFVLGKRLNRDRGGGDQREGSLGAQMNLAKSR